MKTLRCSVVLSTYNGEQYILEQLESIRKQSRIPDEVIIGDDCSTDGTVKIVKNYIEKNSLDWKIVTSEENRGYYRNFMWLSYQAKDDVIFFCDQDDIWKSDKIEVMMNYFEKREDLLAVSCNIQCIDQNGNTIKNHDYFNVKKDTQIKLKNILYTSNILGCTLGFRKELLETVNRKVLKAMEGSHDTLISILAAAGNGLYKISYVGVNYRIHGQNTSMKKGNSRLQQIKSMKYFYCDLNKAIFDKNKFSGTVHRKLENAEELQTERIRWFTERDVWHQFCCIRKYLHFAGGIKRGIRLFMADLYYCNKNIQ